MTAKMKMMLMLAAMTARAQELTVPTSCLPVTGNGGCARAGGGGGSSFDDFGGFGGVAVRPVNFIVYGSGTIVGIETTYVREGKSPFPVRRGKSSSSSDALDLRDDFIKEVVLRTDNEVRYLEMTTMKGEVARSQQSRPSGTQTFKSDDPRDVVLAFYGKSGSRVDALGFRFGPCALCAPGTFINLANEDCKCEACLVGEVSSDKNQLACDVCAAGSTSNADKTACVECEAGSYAPADGGTCLLAEPGTFVADGGADRTTPCPEGTFVEAAGATACDACPAGTFASATGSVVCEPCPAGTFSGVGSAACTDAPQGSFVPEEGATEATLCPFSTFQNLQGQSACKPCGDGSGGSFFLETQSGLTRAVQCECAVDFTGANCDVATCAETLPLVSVGLLLLESSFPEELRESNVPRAARLEAAVTTATKIEAIFRTADTNSDDLLSVREAEVALTLANVVVADLDAMAGNIWSRPLPDRQGSFSPVAEGDVTITEMVREALDSFVEHGTFWPGTYDAAAPPSTSSEGFAITSMQASYPSSAYSFERCEAETNDGVTLDWTFRNFNADDRTLHKQCAYVNGRLLGPDVFTNEMADAALVENGGICELTSGSNATKCAFHDRVGVENNNRKRLYCVRQFYCAGGDDACDASSVVDSLTATRCVTGLAFDGTPSDLVPTYSIRQGVKWQWLDTSLEEKGFRVYRSLAAPSAPLEDLTADDLGQLIADVPVTSAKCGQQFAPLTFADRDTGDVPATRVDYLVATIDEAGAVDKVSRTRYTSPWVTVLTVTVKTESGKPVKDTVITVQHLVADAETGDTAVDPNFAITLTTDAFGSVVHELRVVDPISWTAEQQHLRITPSLCEGGVGVDCVGGFQHTFSVEFEDVVVRHLFEESVAVVDTSTFSVSGFVLFGEGGSTTTTTWRDAAYFGGSAAYDAACPFTVDDGRCYCPVAETSVEFEYADGDVESVNVDEAGFFEVAVAIGRAFVVKFQGYEDHAFDMWKTKFDGGADQGELVETAQEFPKLEFATGLDADVGLVFVDANRGDVEAVVVGGAKEVRFVNGQRLHVRRPECGYKREIVTKKSTTGNVTLPATDFTVEIPREDTNALQPCLTFGSDASRLDEACRVEVPQFRSTNASRLPCAADDLPPGTFVGNVRYVDEYFRNRQDRTQKLDLTTNSSRRLTYRYSAPLCVTGVTVGPRAGTQFASLLPRTEEDDAPRVIYDAFIDAEIPWTEDRPEALLVTPPTIDETFTETVFGRSTTDAGEAIFTEGDEVSVKFTLAEVYPSDAAGALCEWPWDFEGEDALCDTVFDPLSSFDKEASVPQTSLVGGSSLDDIKISVLDGVSGKDLQVDAFAYDIAECDVLDFARLCVGYELLTTVGDPNPFAPFTLPLELVFHREADDSQLFFARDAIAIGAIPEDVPQTYSMVTDPSLIFAVIRDPPGGDSSTTLTKGTSLKTSLAIDGMHTAERSKSENLNFNTGQKIELKGLVAPLGMGIENRISSLDLSQSKSYKGNAPVVHATRASAQHFDLDFNFEVDVSTSTDKFVAGEPSDVIIGGGLNLRVSNAIETVVSTTDLKTFAVEGRPTSQFLPEQISTFVASTYEIEMLMERLAAQHEIERVQSKNDTSAAETLLRAIENWETVLANYRARTKGEDQLKSTLADAVNDVFEHLQVVFSDARKEVTSSASNSELVDAFNADMNAPQQLDDFLSQGLTKLQSVQDDALGSAAIKVAVQDIASARGNPADTKLTNARDAFTKLLGGGIIAASGVAASRANKRAIRIRRFTEAMSDELADAQATNCNAGNVVNLGDLCDAAEATRKKLSLATQLLGVCELQSGVSRAVDAFCQVSDEDIEQSAFDFVSDDTKLLTFGGGASVEMSYTVTQEKRVSQDAKYSATASDQWDSGSSYCFAILRRERNRRALMASKTSVADSLEAREARDRDALDLTAQVATRRRLEEEEEDAPPTRFGKIGRQNGQRFRRSAGEEGGAEEEEANDGETDKAEASADKPSCRRRMIDIGFGTDFSDSGSVGVNLGRAAHKGRAASHTVSLKLADPDPDDYFAVKITADKVSATPIFETLGGATQCPGEAGTTKKDTFITVERINYDYCAAAGFPLCQDVPHGTPITLGVVVQNISPLANQRVGFGGHVGFFYKMFVGAHLNAFQDGTDFCGSPHYSGGLNGLGLFAEGRTLQIPFGQSEILFTLNHADAPFKECLRYDNVDVRIVSDCEYNTAAYQYRTETDEDGVVSVVHPAWDNATLDWFPETQAHIPNRYLDSDGISASTFSISWAPPESRRLLLESKSSNYENVALLLLAVGVSVVLVLVLVAMVHVLKQPLRSHNNNVNSDAVKQPLRSHNNNVNPDKCLKQLPSC